MIGLRVSSTDVWTVAQTAWGEARGDGSASQYAVIWTIRNRHDFHPRWKNVPLVAICRAPMQYSCWNPTDPNYPMVREVNCDDLVFCHCLIAAVDILGGMVMSNVGRSTHYFRAGTPEPAWAQGHTPVCQVGSHLFYDNIA